jgi:hypothetical protein
MYKFKVLVTVVGLVLIGFIAVSIFLDVTIPDSVDRMRECESDCQELGYVAGFYDAVWPVERTGSCWCEREEKIWEYEKGDCFMCWEKKEA